MPAASLKTSALENGHHQNGHHQNGHHGNGQNGHNQDLANSSPVDKLLLVNSPHVTYTESHVTSEYLYYSTRVTRDQNGRLIATPTTTAYNFRTELKPPPTVGVMLVGWGGNNGSTFTAGLLANKHRMSWKTRTGTQNANFYGSITMASTMRLGEDSQHKDVYVPFHQLIPFLHPENLVIGGWDINESNLAEAMERAQVLEPDLRRQLYQEMELLKPLPSIYYPDFIAANQADRANNLLSGTKSQHLEHLRNQIRSFKHDNGLDKVIVLWTANTERFSEVLVGVNDTAENLLKSIKQSHSEVSPSTMFAVASILEGCPFINGSPQNTFVPGVIQLAEQNHVIIGGDDFKSGQTKLKSVLVDFLVSAGIKPLAISSYNHLGNNDGKNLSAPQQFRSKEISKSSVVDDVVESNPILYQPGESPDHIVVIKYVPSVGDSKRALDEYESEIFMGGRSTIVVHNTCEDSLLAAPIILDLILLTELLTRVEYKTECTETYQKMHPIASILSYLLKAPVVPAGAPVINSLFKQRAAIENILRALVGISPQNDMGLDTKAPPQKLSFEPTNPAKVGL